MGLQYGGDYRGMRKISVQDLFRSDQDMKISRIWMRDPFWYDKLSKGGVYSWYYCGFPFLSLLS